MVATASITAAGGSSAGSRACVSPDSHDGKHAQPPRRILFLDAYDSFTNNVVALLKQALDDGEGNGDKTGNARVQVHVLHMDLRTLDADANPDWTPRDLLARLPAYDAVVCGPGPGSPLRAADVGAFNLLWALPPERDVPVLGICLGFQSLVAHLGGGIRRLRGGGLHGMVRDIEHTGDTDIFDGVAPFRATLYHSLCAEVGQDDVDEGDWHAARWRPPACAPQLVPLAWASAGDSSDGGGGGAGGDIDTRILMAARHATRPLWGVQYHPESVCTEPAAHDVIRNWFRHAVKWNEAVSCRVDYSIPCVDSLDPSTRALPGLGPANQHLSVHRWWREMQSGLAARGTRPGYACRALKLPSGVETADVAELFGLGGTETVILDSSSTVNGDPLARNSVIAIDADRALRIEYRVGEGYVTLRIPGKASRPGDNKTEKQEEQVQHIHLRNDDEPHEPWDAWHVLSEFARRRMLNDGDPSRQDPAQTCAFKGGLVGFVTYEMGLSTLSPGLVVARSRGHCRPDICMVWVTRSIVLDHKAGVAWVQTLTTADSDRDDAMAWVDESAEKLLKSEVWQRSGSSSSSSSSSIAPLPTRSVEALLGDDVNECDGSSGRLRFKIPDSTAYEQDVRRCQDAIQDGESYELCLTAQTTMRRRRQQHDDIPTYLQPSPNTSNSTSHSDSSTSWDLYRTLRRRQPAPFGCYLRLAGATLVGSSPERFLRHEAPAAPAPASAPATPAGGGGLCTMRPMKGTVRKSDTVSTLAEAERILHVPKEEAENLMIVDLVRHDLHAVCGAGGVRVPDLLRVEEYASVFQMSTVVEGRLPQPSPPPSPPPLLQAGGRHRGGREMTGIDVLASALPPGSMTGAPKKRSCELLAALEGGERGVYSGVVGYLDVEGRGDWSVTIRTLFRWDDEVQIDDDDGGGGDGGGGGDYEVWRIGAGGAVTALSTPVGEREEMLAKLCGPLGVLRDVA